MSHEVKGAGGAAVFCCSRCAVLVDMALAGAFGGWCEQCPWHMGYTWQGLLWALKVEVLCFVGGRPFAGALHSDEVSCCYPGSLSK